MPATEMVKLLLLMRFALTAVMLQSSCSTRGAKMTSGKIPDWMKAIVAKRQNMKRGLLAFIGVLRKRLAVSRGGTEYTGGRLPRDVVGVISKWAWSTRFDKRWEGAVPETMKKL